MSELRKRLLEADAWRDVEQAETDGGLTTKGLVPEPGIIIDGKMTPTGWGVCTTSGLVYACTPCCASELIYDDDDDTNRCLGCWEQMEPPCEPTFIDVAQPFDPRELKRLSAEWSGYAEAGAVVVRWVIRVSA